MLFLCLIKHSTMHTYRVWRYSYTHTLSQCHRQFK